MRRFNLWQQGAKTSPENKKTIRQCALVAHHNRQVVSEVREGSMRQLKWSRNQAGSLNGKVGHLTLFCIAYYPERGYFISSKLPGLNKTIQVSSEEAGKRKAEVIYQRYFAFLGGADWYQEPEPPKHKSLRVGP